MRKLFAVILILLPSAALAAAPRMVVLRIRNMDCPVCTITIRKALEKVSGVTGVQVDYSHKTATVRYDASKTTPAALVKATTNAGFPSTVQNKVQKP